MNCNKRKVFLSIVALILAGLVGCTKNDKQSVEAAKTAVSNKVVAATGGGDGKSIVLKYIDAVKAKDIESAFNATNESSKIDTYCNDLYKQEIQAVKDVKISECKKSGANVIKEKIEMDIKYNPFPDGCKFEYLESKPDGQKTIHYIKAEFADINNVPGWPGDEKEKNPDKIVVYMLYTVNNRLEVSRSANYGTLSSHETLAKF